MRRILLVDDNGNDVKQLVGFLDHHYELVVANDFQTATKLAVGKGPQLILVDVNLAETEGVTASQIASLSGDGAVPIIFIAERNRTEDIVKAFGCGGQDYIAKPFFRDELLARLGLQLELRQSRVDLSECAAALEQKNCQLRDILEQLEKVALIDLLTAIPNRLYMLERMKEEEARSFRYQRPLAVIAVNIDNFCAVINKFGRECGDVVLQSIADILRSKRRGHDVVARWDKDEFLVMLPETSIADGGILAERIRGWVEDAKIDYSGTRVPVTVTIGVAELDPNTGIERAVEKAMAAVTEEKQKAKNCVILSHNI